VLVLPGLSPSEPEQWLLFSRAVARLLPAAAPSAAASGAAIAAFAVSAAADPAAKALLAPLVTGATIQILAPHWHSLDCPCDLVGSVDALPAPHPAEPSAAVYSAATLASAVSLRRLLQLWPIDTATGSSVCGISASVADVFTVVKLLTGSDADASSASGVEVIAFCRARLNQMPHDTHAAIVAWAVLDEQHVECPAVAAFRVPGAPLPPRPLPLHPLAKLHLLDDLQSPEDALALHIPRDAAAKTTRELQLWLVLANALAATGDAAVSTVLAEPPMLLEASDTVLETARQCAHAGEPGAAPHIVGAWLLRAGAEFSVVKGAVHRVNRLCVGTDTEHAINSREIVHAVYDQYVSVALAAVRDAIAAADSDEEDAEAKGATGLWHVELVVQSLCGEEAGSSSDNDLRIQVWESVVRAMHEVHVAAPATTLQHPLMCALMKLQAEAASPENWGVSGADTCPSVLGSQTRASLGAAFPDAEVPADGATSSLQAAESLFLRLLESSTNRQQLLSLYTVLADVWGFGAELPESTADDACSVRMHASAEALAANFATFQCLPECLNLIHMRVGGGSARCISEDAAPKVIAAVDATFGPVASCAARLVTGIPNLVHAALAALSSGELLGEVAAHRAGEPADLQFNSAMAAAALLLGLRNSPVASVQQALCKPKTANVVQALIQRLPFVGTGHGERGSTRPSDPCPNGEISTVPFFHFSDRENGIALRLETALPEFLVWLCLEGQAGGMMLAGGIVADYVGLHAGMRDACAEIAMLKQYLMSTRARAVANEVSSQNGGVHACLVPGIGRNRADLLAALSEAISSCEDALHEVF
jgi:hypothetical protein